MPERWILNASPLIVMARIGYEGLFAGLADEVVVPRAVALEVQAGLATDPACQALTAGRFQIVATPPPPAEILAWDLGAGETAVLAQALAESGWSAILDDAAARRCVRCFALPVRGTLAIVILARQRGLISSATEVLQALKGVGFRLDDPVIQDALARTVGEQWI